jgi:hypothetical protein
MERRKLTDILRAGNGGGWINDDWSTIRPAPDFAPIPPGKYIAWAIDGELFNAGTGTPGYKLTFQVREGEHKGRKVWYDIWLTDAARSQARRDFAKLGVETKDQLEQPLPKWIRCEVHVTLRANDRGEEFNHVRRFDVLGIDPPDVDPFAPPADNGDGKPNDGKGAAS